MNLASFSDELMKLGGVTVIVKAARIVGADPPDGMVGNEPEPDPEPDMYPDRAETRMPHSKVIQSQVRPGALGGVTAPQDAISEQRFNQLYRT
jgi:hypothetical protein